MYTTKQTTKLLESFHSNVFGYGHRGVAKFFKGNYNAAVFLDRLIYKLDYWTKKNSLQEDGAFYYTVPDVEGDIYLTKRVQDGLIKKFVKLGLMEVSNRGMNNARHFKLYLDKIHAFLAQCAEPVKKKEVTEDKKKPTKYKLCQPVRTKSSITKKPLTNTNSFNSSSQEIDVKDEEEKMSHNYQQHLYEFCKEVVGMSRSQAKKTIQQCMHMGITLFSMESLREAHKLFKDEINLSGRISVPHKFFAKGIDITLTNMKNRFVAPVNISENAIFYDWVNVGGNPCEG